MSTKTRQRRRYTDEFKRQVVAESFDPEISVAEAPIPPEAPSTSPSPIEIALVCGTRLRVESHVEEAALTLRAAFEVEKAEWLEIEETIQMLKRSTICERT